MTRSELIKIRPYADTADEALIYATWLRGLYHSDTWYSRIKKDVFMLNYHNVIERILKSPTTKISIACLREDDNVIIGYSVGNVDDTVVHFIFVKKRWRKIGVAKLLIPIKPISVTHLTQVGLALINKLKIDFNPFIL